jgi:hypothetical protein
LEGGLAPYYVPEQPVARGRHAGERGGEGRAMRDGYPDRGNDFAEERRRGGGVGGCGDYGYEGGEGGYIDEGSERSGSVEGWADDDVVVVRNSDRRGVGDDDDAEAKGGDAAEIKSLAKQVGSSQHAPGPQYWH